MWGCLVDQYREGHPVAVLQLLPSHALRHLRQTDQTAVGHLAIHIAGGNPRFSETEKSPNQSQTENPGFVYLYETQIQAFSCRLETALLSLQFPHLRRSPEYFSTATSLGREGIEEGLGFPADAAGAGLLWEGGGERIVSVTLLVLSTGWKELPIFISTSGPLSSDEKAVKKIHWNHHFQ